MKYSRLVLLTLNGFPMALPAQGAQPDTSIKVTFGGFVDAYYAWDFGRPPSFDRSFAGGTVFTTQPARHNEFNVNLAFVEAKIDAPRVVAGSHCRPGRRCSPTTRASPRTAA